MHKNLRHSIFIGALWLLLFNHATYTIAQDNSVTVDDLPSCAVRCAKAAAVTVDCDTQDTTCLCSHQRFSAVTDECVKMFCSSEDLGLTQEVLMEMCSNTENPTTSSTSDLTSSTTGKSTTTASTSTSTTSTKAQSTSTSTFTSTSTAVVLPTTTSSPSTTQSASSTVVIVQTVIIQPSTTLISAAGRLDTGSVFMGTVALATFIFGLPYFIWFVAAI